MTIESKIVSHTIKALHDLYNHELKESDVQLQPTRKEFVGDFTIVVFPFLRVSKKSPAPIS